MMADRDGENNISNPTKFDPITLEILWRRLVSIVDEADASVARTAFSSLLRDAHATGNRTQAAAVKGRCPNR